MIKKGLSLFLILVIIFTPVSFAQKDTQVKTCKLSINGDFVSLDLTPLIINGVPMLPMREFFEKLDTKVNWFPKTREVSAYKSNMFVRLQIDNDTAYRNGKSYKLKHAPVIIKGHTYIPAKFTSESFNMTYTFSNNTISLKGRDSSRVSFINDIQYSSYTIDEFGMKIDIPYGWKELSKNKFGRKDDYDDYSLSIKKYDNDEKYTLAEYKKKYKEALLDKYKTALSFTYDSTHITDDMSFDAFGYFYNSDLKKRLYDIYILENNGQFFIFEGSYAINTDEKYIRDIYHEILNKVQLVKDTVESSDEHYIEYPKAFEVELKLDNELTSNHEVESFFVFSGSIKDTKNYDSLFVIVSKNGNRMTFNVDLQKDGTFTSKIYTPFGLNKHNIEVYAHGRDGKENALLIKFSALNLSNEVTRYLIPTQYVQTNATEAMSLANFLTYQSTSAYLKAKAIFDYTITDITLENMTLKSLEKMRNSTEVIIEKKATPLEICITMTTLLRASDIPAKVVLGKIEGEQYYAVETKINGKWMVYDPVSGIRTKANPDLSKKDDLKTPLNYSSSHYHLALDTYKALFDNYRVLDY